MQVQRVQNNRTNFRGNVKNFVTKGLVTGQKTPLLKSEDGIMYAIVNAIFSPVEQDSSRALKAINTLFAMKNDTTLNELSLKNETISKNVRFYLGYGNKKQYLKQETNSFTAKSLLDSIADLGEQLYGKEINIPNEELYRCIKNIEKSRLLQGIGQNLFKEDLKGGKYLRKIEHHAKNELSPKSEFESKMEQRAYIELMATIHGGLLR